MDYRLEKLKSLVIKKINLEKNQKIDTSEYKNLNKDINDFLKGLNNDDTKYIKALCKQEYQNCFNYYKGDIANNQRNKIDEKMDIILECVEVLKSQKEKNKKKKQA